jgi:hypothetical protein
MGSDSLIIQIGTLDKKRMHPMDLKEKENEKEERKIC